MKTFVHFALILSLLGLVVSAAADTINLEPSDDMYSDPDHTSAHPVGELWVANYTPTGHFERIMIKFDLSQFNNETINGATLNLYRFFGCPSGDPTNTNIYAITENWDENTWQETQHISYDATTTWANHIFTVNGWHSIDITSLVQSWVNGSVTNCGLVIKALDNNKFTKCYSKEASSQSLRPYLEIDYEASGVVSHNASLISNYALGAFPNPFNPITQVTFDLVDAGEVELMVYDLMGREIAKLADGFYNSGSNKVAFDGSLLPSGIYIVRLEAGRYSESVKLLLLK